MKYKELSRPPSKKLPHELDETKHKVRNTIFQSNYLTNTYLPFSKTESNIMAIILATLKKETRVYNWRVRDLLKYLKISDRNYTFLTNALDGLYEKSIVIKHQTETEKIRLLSRIIYVDSVSVLKMDDTVSLTISEEIVPHLFNLKTYFTSYETKSYLRLQSLMAKKLYTLFAQYKNTGAVLKTKEELQTVLGTNYKDFSVLMAKNIKPAIKEIEEVTNVNDISIHPIKSGRVITCYKFIFGWQTPQLELTLLPPSMNSKQLSLYEKLLQIYHLTNHQASTILGHVSEKEIHKNLHLIQQNKKDIKNLSAYTVALFKDRNGVNFIKEF